MPLPTYSSDLITEPDACGTDSSTSLSRALTSCDGPGLDPDQSHDDNSAYQGSLLFPAPSKDVRTRQGATSKRSPASILRDPAVARVPISGHGVTYGPRILAHNESTEPQHKYHLMLGNGERARNARRVRWNDLDPDSKYGPPLESEDSDTERSVHSDEGSDAKVRTSDGGEADSHSHGLTERDHGMGQQIGGRHRYYQAKPSSEARPDPSSSWLVISSEQGAEVKGSTKEETQRGRDRGTDPRSASKSPSAYSRTHSRQSHRQDSSEDETSDRKRVHGHGRTESPPRRSKSRSRMSIPTGKVRNGSAAGVSNAGTFFKDCSLRFKALRATEPNRRSISP